MSGSLVAVGCDDGEVRKLDPREYTTYACVSMERLDRGIRPRSVYAGLLRIDGLDATSLISYAARILGGQRGVVMLNSITIAGFNVVSPPGVYRITGMPVIVAYKYRPNRDRLLSAARKLPTYDLVKRAISVLQRVSRVDTRKGPLYMLSWGISEREAVRVVEEFQLYAREPEPVRAAHYIASALSRGIIWRG